MDILRRLRIVTLCVPFALASSMAEAQDPDPVAVSAAPQAPDSGGGFVGGARRWADKHQIIGRLNGDVDGWYPRLGGMTRGGGFAFGPGYRTHVFDDRVLVDVSAAFSTKTYKAVDGKVRWLQAFDDRLEVWTTFRYEDFPQEDYFGPGLSSTLDGRTSYGFENHDFIVRGIARPRPWWSAGANIGYMMLETTGGSDSQYPSIEELYTDAEAPGLFTTPNYLHSTLFTEVDYRDVAGNPGSGGFYRLSFGVWDDRTLGGYDFRRLDVNVNQWVPLEPAKQHVVFGRVGLAYVNNEDTSRVPFYFLPYVGGVDTIRSFREFRYRDENAIWLGVEYLYRPIPYINLAAFFDAGEVAPDWQDINLGGLKKGYGFGVRFGTAKQQFGRMDVGFGGGEGTRVFFKFGLAL